MKDRTLVEEIKRKVTIKSVIDKFGGAELHGDGDTLTGWHKAHDSESKRSLHVDNAKGVWNCKNCGLGGDVFSWVGHLRRNGTYSDRDSSMFGEAMREVAAFAGVEVPEYDAEKAQERRGIEDVWGLAADYYHRQLTDDRRDYFHKRGYSDETINKYKLGYATPGARALLSELVTVHKVDGEELAKSGLFLKRDNGALEDHFQGRLMFPYWRNGRIVYFIGRITDESPAWEQEKKMKYKKLLVHNDKHPYVSEQVSNRYFYGEDSVKTGGDLLITEGVADCLSALQAGFACVSPVTIRFAKKDHTRILELAERAGTVYICNDNEESSAGENGTLATAKVLWENGKVAKLVTLPRPAGVAKVDLNDYLVANGAPAFAALLPTAKTLLDLKADEYAAAATDDARLAAQRAVIDLVSWVKDKLQLELWKRKLPKLLGLSTSIYNALIRAAQQERSKAKAIEERSTRTTATIQVNNRQLSDVSADALSAIRTHNETNPAVFVRAGALARVAQDERGLFGIQELNSGSVQHVLSNVAEWESVVETESGFKTQAVYPPHTVGVDVLSAGEWPGLPGLAGIVTAPVFSRDGELHDQPGYNPATRLYYTGGAKVGDTTPTPENIHWAKELILNNLLVDFPFKDDASLAHAVAYMLLPFARTMIDGPTPPHLVESPTAGTGKGMLITACAYPFLGHDASTMAAAKDDDEWRKRITTSLMGGNSHLVIDNVNHELDSGPLASAFTQPVWEDRTLGFNRDVKIPIRTVWAITANNIKMSQELARRCLWVRMDASEEKPWERTGFKHKHLIAWVRCHRDELATAALCCVRAWIDKGMPVYTERTKGSYESWAGVMGGILEAVGITGFLENETELYDRVVAKNDLLDDFVKTWWAKFGNKDTSAHELFMLASYSDSQDEETKKVEQSLNVTWHNLLGDMLTSPKQQGRKTQLGTILNRLRDNVIAGYKITFAKAQKGMHFWRLEAKRVDPQTEGLPTNEGSTHPLPRVEAPVSHTWVDPSRPSHTLHHDENSIFFNDDDEENSCVSDIARAGEGLPGSTYDGSTTYKNGVDPQNGGSTQRQLLPADLWVSGLASFAEAQTAQKALSGQWQTVSGRDPESGLWFVRCPDWQFKEF